MRGNRLFDARTRCLVTETLKTLTRECLHSIFVYSHVCFCCEYASNRTAFLCVTSFGNFTTFIELTQCLNNFVVRSTIAFWFKIRKSGDYCWGWLASGLTGERRRHRLNWRRKDTLGCVCSLHLAQSTSSCGVSSPSKPSVTLIFSELVLSPTSPPQWRRIRLQSLAVWFTTSRGCVQYFSTLMFLLTVLHTASGSSWWNLAFGNVCLNFWHYLSFKFKSMRVHRVLNAPVLFLSTWAPLCLSNAGPWHRVRNLHAKSGSNWR